MPRFDYVVTAGSSENDIHTVQAHQSEQEATESFLAMVAPYVTLSVILGAGEIIDVATRTL